MRHSRSLWPDFSRAFLHGSNKDRDAPALLDQGGGVCVWETSGGAELLDGPLGVLDVFEHLFRVATVAVLSVEGLKLGKAVLCSADSLARRWGAGLCLFGPCKGLTPGESVPREWEEDSLEEVFEGVLAVKTLLVLMPFWCRSAFFGVASQSSGSSWLPPRPSND